MLIAALIASVVLYFASAIFSIAQKQITLASFSQQSQYAFYAADSAAECVLYWDNIGSIFAAPTPLSSPVSTCDGQTLSFTAGPATSYSYITNVQRFSINGTCADATIEKCQGTIDPGGVCTFVSGGATSTQIRADGFNVACGAVASSPNALERSVNLTY